MVDKDNKQADLIHLEYERLIESGTILLQEIHAGDIDIDVTGISSWVTASIDRILPLMPLDIPEYKKLEDLRSIYEKMALIVPSSVSSDIRCILENLKMARNVFCCGRRGDARDIPAKNYADIEYEEIKQAREYVGSNVIEKLIGKEDGRTKNTAMLHLYRRLYSWACSISRLDNREDCLGIAACTRGMLEVFIDLNLVFCEIIENGIEKYFSHEESNKHRAAETITEFRRKHNLKMPDEMKPTEKYLQNNPKQKVQEMRDRVWGKSKKEKMIVPQHWSNKKVIERIELIEDKRVSEIYLDSYYYCNWFVHSGYTNFGRDIEEIHRLMGHLYSVSGDMFREGTFLINKQISVMSEEDIKKINYIRELSVRRIWEELVKIGRQKQSAPGHGQGVSE